MSAATRRWGGLLLALAAGAAFAEGVPLAAEVIQPRAFGHVIGDLLEQRVLLEAEGAPFQPAELPAAERLGVWFERRSARIEQDDAGRRWLAVRYQLVNAPGALQVVTLPGWQLAAAGGGPALAVAAWPLSVTPLSGETAVARDGLGELRPDRPPPPRATAPLRRQALLGSGALALTLAAWGGWLAWRNLRAAARRPFARALVEMRGLADDAPEAWQALHRAFDRSAGQVVASTTLARLFERQPALAPLESEIERFFRDSDRRFFAGQAVPDGVSPRALCRRLRRLEKAAGR